MSSAGYVLLVDQLERIPYLDSWIASPVTWRRGSTSCSISGTQWKWAGFVTGTSTRWHRTLFKERQRLYEALWPK